MSLGKQTEIGARARQWRSAAGRTRRAITAVAFQALLPDYGVTFED